MNITGSISNFHRSSFNFFDGAFNGFRYGSVFASTTEQVENSLYDSFSFDASRTWTGNIILQPG